MATVTSMVQEKALNSRRLFIHSLTSLTDQALLSALNLVVGLVLIRLATKETYGLYAQIYVVGIFASTIVEALVTNPLTTIAPGKSAEERAQLFAHIKRLQLRVNSALAILFGIGTAIAVALTNTDPQPWLLGITFAVYIFFNAQREYVRSVGFIESRPHQVLIIDASYVVTVLTGIATLVLFRHMSVSMIILTLGAANIISLSIANNRTPAYKTRPAATSGAWSQLWARGKWALPGALVAWFTNYSYLFLAAAFLGITASADLNAARLLLMPVSLCVLAWSRIARPVASRLYAAKNWQHLNRLAWMSVIGMEVIIAVYVTVLWLLLPWLQSHVLGPQYHNTSPLILAWGFYFAVNAARWIGSSWLSSNDQYRQLLISGVASLIVMLIASLALIPLYGAKGAVAALIIVEVFDLVLIWAVFLPMARRKHT